ncbi:prion-inhibition and propagation-domain-containing protein [Leptodontidium sp. 2 PMI_412]|nr:prion-inhibition and propagation-domain-containing protein [Leptodontidium sp. 2 PMI_412]
MASLSGLLRSCMESFKSILTSQEFGTEYELLCTELSVQWLRVRLWGESIGLHFDQDGRLEEPLSNRSDVESTITSCVNSIAFLLSEIETLRQNYEFRPPLELISDNSPSAEKSVRRSKSLGRLSSITAVSSLRQRMRDNQKQKSFIAITKWAMCDAKRFDERVKRLKGLVDGLEDVSRAASIARQPARTRSLLTLPSPEHPPPYSFTPPLGRRPEGSTTPAMASFRRISTARQERELPKHYENLKRHAGQSTQDEESRRVRTQEKLLKLTNTQLYELRVDVCDELNRREQADAAPPFLPANPSYHPKRNVAREKISALPPHRFRDLTMDLVFELERRFPHLWLQAIPELEQATHQTDPFSLPRDSTTRRYGCVIPSNYPPPLLKYRAKQRRTLVHVPGTAPNFSRLPLSSRFSQSSTTLGQVGGPTYKASEINTQTTPSTSPTRTSAEIFKSFRVGMEDPCYKVLPAALKKYNINAAWEQYALYIVYGDKERCLGMEEKPLLLFKQLDKEGKKPMFMLRRISPAGLGIDVVPKAGYEPPGGIL